MDRNSVVLVCNTNELLTIVQAIGYYKSKRPMSPQMLEASKSLLGQIVSILEAKEKVKDESPGL